VRVKGFTEEGVPEAVTAADYASNAVLVMTTTTVH
jgi:hypothetical protein